MDITWVLLFGVFVKVADVYAASCGLAEEGSTFQLSYQVTSNTVTTAHWSQDTGDFFPAILGNCQKQPSGWDCSKDQNYEMKKNGDQFILVISSVSRAVQTSYDFTARADGDPSFTAVKYSCNLLIYVKPESPRCDPPTLTTDNTALSVTCSTNKVFPQAQCEFRRQGNPQGDLSSVTYDSINYTETANGRTYNRANCTLTYPVNSAASYAFVVDMYAYINNTCYGRQESQVSDSITLTLPQVGLAADCPSGDNVKNGYIKTGTTATCRCDRVQDGLPVGQARWFDGNQEMNTGPSNDRSATITLSDADSVKTFTCKGKSTLGVQPTGESFKPKFAYGPNQVNIDLEGSTSTTINLCPNTNHDVTIQCQVPKSDVSPGPNFTVLFNGRSKPGNSTESDMLYMYTVRDTLNTAGNLNVSCGAENSLFSDLNKQSHKQISVQEPPKSPPQLIINNNQPVIENVPFTVSCSVDGGFPLVSGVNIICRSGNADVISVTSVTNVVSQSVTVNRTMDGAQCDCVAHHVTGCYNNNTNRAGLAVTYQAAVKTLTANNMQNIQNLTLDMNDTMSLTCVADGNPPPTITILNHRTTEPQKSGEGHNLTYVKDILACIDTAIYTCEATSFVTTDKMSQKQVHLFVRCPQQPQHADNTTFSATVGESVTLDLDVIGYPAPTVYTLRQKQTTVAQVDTPDGNGRDGTYQFMYESNDPPRGTVHLTIGNLSKGHFTDYLLIIENGVGQALEFSFVLETEVPSSDTDIVPVVVGVIVGVLVLVVVVIIIILLKRRGLMELRTQQI